VCGFFLDYINSGRTSHILYHSIVLVALLLVPVD
jgi:hypothetical protein